MAKDRSVSPPELDDVANQVGEFIEYWGFKRVHGRIWTHLYLSPQPLDAGTLIQRLKISKALLSMSLSDLQQYDVVQVAGKSERGLILYRANPEIISVIKNVLRQRERILLARVAGSTRLLRDLPQLGPSSCSLDPVRVEGLIDMVKCAEESLDSMLSLETVDFSKWSHFND